MDKKLDRMPKEYKIAIYAIILGTAYFFLYSLIFYAKFKFKPFFIGALAIVFIYLLLTFFLIRKSNLARILLVIVSVLQSVLFIVIFVMMLFFKQSAVILSKLLHIGAFSFYILMGQIGTTPNKGIFASLIIAAWGLAVAYLLMNKETSRYIHEKTYELVDTHKETSVAIIVLFAIIVILYFLVRF